MELALAFNDDLVYNTRRSHRKEISTANLLGLQRRPFRDRDVKYLKSNYDSYDYRFIIY